MRGEGTVRLFFPSTVPNFVVQMSRFLLRRREGNSFLRKGRSSHLFFFPGGFPLPSTPWKASRGRVGFLILCMFFTEFP